MKKDFLLPCLVASVIATLIAYVAVNPPAFGQGSPGWVKGYIPPAFEINSWLAKKVDVTGGLSNGQTINNPKSINGVNDPIATQDVANKRYVDNHITGQTPQQGVLLATTTALAANTYNNGTAGLGATITITANGALSIDGTVVPLNARVLIKDENTGSHNGCYVQTQLGTVSIQAILTRCTDWDVSGKMSPFSFFFVSSGTAPPSGNAATGWTMLTPTPVTVGSTSLSFSQSSQTQAYTASTGLGLSGNAFRILTTGVVANTYGDGTHIPAITFNAQGDATAASNVPIGPDLPIAGYFAASGTGPGSSSTTNSVFGENQIRFRQNPGEETNSGVIDHGNLDANALSIVGKGNSAGNRTVNVFDNLIVKSQLYFGGWGNAALGICCGPIGGTANQYVWLHDIDATLNGGIQIGGAAAPFGKKTFYRMDVHRFDDQAGAVIYAQIDGTGTYVKNLSNNAFDDYVCYRTSDGLIGHSNSGKCGPSDARLKTNFGSTPGLKEIMALHPVSFDWLDDNKAKQQGRQLGLTAQDVEKVIPALVSTEGTTTVTLANGKKRVIQNTKSVDYVKLVVPLIKAVQELQAEVESLRRGR